MGVSVFTNNIFVHSNRSAKIQGPGIQTDCLAVRIRVIAPLTRLVLHPHLDVNMHTVVSCRYVLSVYMCSSRKVTIVCHKLVFYYRQLGDLPQVVF